MPASLHCVFSTQRQVDASTGAQKNLLWDHDLTNRPMRRMTADESFGGRQLQERQSAALVAAWKAPPKLSRFGVLKNLCVNQFSMAVGAVSSSRAGGPHHEPMPTCLIGLGSNQGDPRARRWMRPSLGWPVIRGSADRFL